MIKNKMLEVLDKIESTAKKVGRNPLDIKLIVVTKTHSVEKIRKVVDAGHCLLGESRVQEAMTKIDQFGPEVRWHLVGHLQRNKAKHAIGLFDLVHSVDSLSLAREISKRSLSFGKVQKVLIQINVSGEESKFGVDPGNLKELLENIVHLPGIKVRGLMTIPPFFKETAKVRPFFAKLREIAEAAEGSYWPNTESIELSMGMSGDFDIAIEEGATLVRVGTAIMGHRDI